MADPLSAAASIVAVVQISQAVLSTCFQYISCVKNAPREIHRAASEIGSLKVILGDLKTLVETASIEQNDQMVSLQKATDAANGPVKTCQTILLELKEMLGLPTDLISMGRAIIWPWKEKSVCNLLDHIQRQKENIILALGTDQTFATLEIRRDLKELRTSLRQEKVLSWLSDIDPSSNHNAACEKHEPLTGTWLLTSDEFTKFVSGSKEWLWCHGIPGCGKTVLFSTALEYIKAIHNSLPDTLYAYFYFDFNDARKQNANGMLCSILIQLANQSPTIMEELEKLHEKNNNGYQKPQSGDLLRTLAPTKDGSQRVYILLDALDECSDRENLMHLLSQIKTSVQENVSLLITSRKERDLELGLENLFTSQVALNTNKVDPDIRLFVQQSLASDNRLRRWSDSVKKDIETVLTEQAQGMFCWVVCQLSVLKRCLKLSVLEKALKELPKTLDETYDRILAQIPEDYRSEAIAALRWLAFSYRPLTVKELAEAVVIGPDSFNCSERLLDPLDVLEVCSSLVVLRSSENEPYAAVSGSLEIVQTPEEVRLAHYSVKDFLVSDRIAMLSSDSRLFALERRAAHIEIARACMLYLTSDYFGNGACETRIQFKTRVEEFPLLKYAGLHWSHHTAEPGVQEHVTDLLGRLLTPRKIKYLATALQATLEDHLETDALNLGDDFKVFGVLQDKDGTLREDEISCSVNPLLFAAESGLHTVLPKMVESGLNINASDTHGRTALGTATSYGLYECVVTLLDLGAELNRYSEPFGSALMTAARSGHQSIAGLLLDRGADLSATNDRDRTVSALKMAVHKPAMIEFLLTQYPQSEAYWKDAMKLAGRRGLTDSVAMLLWHKPESISDEDEYIFYVGIGKNRKKVNKSPRQFLIDAGYDPSELINAHKKVGEERSGAPNKSSI